MIHRALKGTHYKLPSPVFVDLDEVPTDADATPTCTVVNAAGTTLTAPTVSAVDATDGQYTALLTDTVHTAELDELTATWAADVGTYQRTFTQTIEIVGGHYCSIAEIRAEPGMADSLTFPTALLREIRNEVEQVIEDALGWALVPRFRRALFYGDGGDRIDLPTPKASSLLAATVDGSSVSTANFEVDSYHSEVIRTDGTFPSSSDGTPNVTLAWVHGDQAPPPRIRREALRLIRNEAFARISDQPSQVIAQTFEGMTLRYSTPDPANNRPTGVLTLDPIIVNMRGIAGVW